MIDTTTLAKGAHVTGDDRVQLGVHMRAEYEKGASIRELSESSGRSFGFINKLLREAGTTIRARGGANRKV